MFFCSWDPQPLGRLDLDGLHFPVCSDFEFRFRLLIVQRLLLKGLNKAASKQQTTTATATTITTCYGYFPLWRVRRLREQGNASPNSWGRLLGSISSNFLQTTILPYDFRTLHLVERRLRKKPYSLRCCPDRAHNAQGARKHRHVHASLYHHVLCRVVPCLAIQDSGGSLDTEYVLHHFIMYWVKWSPDP